MYFNEIKNKNYHLQTQLKVLRAVNILTEVPKLTSVIDYSSILNIYCQGLENKSSSNGLNTFFVIITFT